MAAHQEKAAWSTIFVTRRYCWSVPKPCFGVVSIGVEKQTQMMVVHQNILSTIMLKTIKLCYGNVRFQRKYARPEMYVVIFIFYFYKITNFSNSDIHMPLLGWTLISYSSKKQLPTFITYKSEQWHLNDIFWQMVCIEMSCCFLSQKGFKHLIMAKMNLSLRRKKTAVSLTVDPLRAIV